MWTPTDFDAYRTLYPATPALAIPDRALTGRFTEAWEWSDAERAARLKEACAGLKIRFVRGYLGNWMPGNLVKPAEALRELGIDAQILRNRAGATVRANAEGLLPQLPDEARVLFCGHSKGGLESLLATDLDRGLADRTVGVVLSQTPRGPSGVLESLLERTHEDTLSGRKRWAEEWVHRMGLHVIGAARGGRELTRAPLEAIVAELESRSRSFPVWQTASWSSQPTTWLDSFHGRLEEIRPGCAHDGQFFLEDLLWPGLPHVLLAHVDHAQPVVGGFGFDEARYWGVLIALFAADAAA